MSSRKVSPTQRRPAPMASAQRRSLRAAAPRRDNGALVRAPAAMNRGSRSRVQRTVTHRECERVGTVVGSVSFANVLNLAINPGLAESFPWLSGVAQHYERYRIDSLKVRYKNLKGTSSDGNVLMSFDYDTLDAGPTSAVVATQSTIYEDGAPWRIFEMTVRPDGTKKYIRQGAVAGADLKTYDMGRLWISAEGCADTSDHGYIELEYVVSLFEKQTAAGASVAANSKVAIFNLPSTQTMSAVGVVEITEEVVNIASGPTNVGGVVTLPLGNWLVTAEASEYSSAIDSTATLEIRVDGASMSIPCLIWPGGGATGDRSACSGTTFVQSDGTTTVDLYFNAAAPTHYFQQDACRLILVAL